LASDIKLLAYVAAGLFFFMAIMLLLTLRQAGRVRGATNWLWSTLLVAIAIALYASQDRIPDLVGIVASHALMVVGSMVNLRGTFEYRYHRAMPATPYYIAAGAMIFLIVYFVYVEPNPAARRLVVALSICAVCFWHAWVMLAGSIFRPQVANLKNARFRLAHGIMVLGLLTIATVFLMITVDATRAPSFVRGGNPSEGSRNLILFFHLGGIVGRVLLLIGMVLVLIDELDHALRKLAFRDVLTGLFNRRGFLEAAALHSLANSSLLMVDLDRFKAVNDEFGHDQGDRLIELFARCAQANLPLNSVLARLGGEEFCALLPQSDSAAAAASAETLRAAFERDSVVLGHARQHTVSIGVASAQSETTTLAQLMTIADQALYRAKHDGRNRVAVADAA